MKTWQQLISSYWDEVAIYIFTIVCTLFGGYIQSGVKPDFGWLPLAGAMISSVLFVLVADLMQGKVDTPQKRAGKKRNFKLNLLIAGALGLGSSVVMPALIKMIAGFIGVTL